MIKTLIVYVTLFVVIMNIDWALKKLTKQNPPRKTMMQWLIFPAVLGILLTIVHFYVRFMFYQRMVVFIVLAAIAYWFFNIFLRK
ncbi:MAG: hypothetical protein ACM3UZ_11020 [Acidobacteriota bacterium]